MHFVCDRKNTCAYPATGCMYILSQKLILFVTRVDAATNETSIEIIGRYGCESDLNHIGDRQHYCSEHKVCAC